MKRKGATDGSVSDNGRMIVMVHLHVATLASGLGKFPTTYLKIIKNNNNNIINVSNSSAGGTHRTSVRTAAGLVESSSG